MIPRNTTIPTKKTETFSTAADSQTSVEVHVLQGERPMAAQNRTLGKFHLTGIPPAPRGVPQIEVTFDIDANGILNVTAKDTATQKDQKITITSSSGLSKEEVERMAKEADAHSAEDKAARDSIEAKNQLDTMVYQIEKMLREQGDKISGSERGDVENALADAKKALDAVIELSRGGLGVPLQKVASVIGKSQKFLDLLGEDVHIDQVVFRENTEGRRGNRRRVRRRRAQEVTCQLAGVVILSGVAASRSAKQPCSRRRPSWQRVRRARRECSRYCRLHAEQQDERSGMKPPRRARRQ